MRLPRTVLSGALLALFSLSASAQEHQHHVAPEELGKVSFPLSCKPAVHPGFERGLALLHSFAYAEAQQAFLKVAADDPSCAMAHWGVAASQYHQLWQPPLEASALERGRAAIQQAQGLPTSSPREKGFIEALAAFYAPADADVRSRALTYETKMAKLAADFPRDSEAQIFYALALLATASPADATHAKQKKAAAILEPLKSRNPQHPGIVHYLIHAYDNTAMAANGLPAAREYARIAPSAPHALHMPSHIFTRRGLWQDSIASNRAARVAAQQQGDIGEVLHSMDYLMYAYLQAGRLEDAATLLSELKAMDKLQASYFKVGYAASAMPVRYAVERSQWKDAAALKPLPGARPEVAALAHWANAIGFARLGDADSAASSLDALAKLHEQLQAARNEYWAAQVGFQLDEASAWLAFAKKNSVEALRLMRQAADAEDALDKLPMTPGPVVPAREQLGDLLLALDRPAEALAEFEKALVLSPNRRNSLAGALRAAEAVKDKARIGKYRAALRLP